MRSGRRGMCRRGIYGGIQSGAEILAGLGEEQLANIESYLGSVLLSLVQISEQEKKEPNTQHKKGKN